jgi:predicted dehydrogenase
MARPLRIGLIGAGAISEAHLAAISASSGRVTLAAVCDIDEESARARAREASVDAVYTDPEKMLREAAIDAVDICTPHDQHAPLAIAAAQAGRHVLVEKPMACSLGQAQAMIDAADRAGVTLMVAQYQRYVPSHQAALAAIQAGEIGPIHSLRFEVLQCYPSTVPAGHWLYDGNRAGGGVVISVAVHGIDLMRYLVGEVASVSALCSAADRELFVGDAEGTVAATLRFVDDTVGEMFATVEAYRVPWFEKFMIFGSRGTIHSLPVPDRYLGVAAIASAARSPQIEGFDDSVADFTVLNEDAPLSGFTNQMLHFASCADSGEEPLSSGRDNLETMRVVFGIYESARTGTTIDLRAP